MGYKDIGMEDPWVPVGEDYVQGATKRYREHFGQDPPASKVADWEACQREARRKGLVR